MNSYSYIGAGPTMPQQIQEPQQARSRETLERILTSGATLIENKPYSAVSIAEIAGLAGVSVGSFYTRFANKEALFQALQKQLAGETQARIDAALTSDWQDKSFRELLQHIVRNNAELYKKYRGVLAAVHVKSRVLDTPVADSQRIAYNENIVKQMEALILKKRDEITHAPPGPAIRVAIACMSAMLREALVFGDASLLPGPGSFAAIVRQVTDVMHAYLIVRVP